MSKSSKSRRFFHSSSALALGGFLTEPSREDIVSQVSSTLPPSGGYGAHRLDNFKFKEIVSFESASTEVIGNYDEKSGTHSTLSTSIVKGLNVLGVVTADAVVARLASSYVEKAHTLGTADPTGRVALQPSSQSGPSGEGQPGERRSKYNIIGSHFVNLCIGGRLIDARPMAEAADVNEVELMRLLEERPTRQPLFLSTTNDEKAIPMHGAHIPEFGRVFIGEFLPDRHSPRLTMLRFELGCAVRGEVSFAIVQGGGQDWP